MKLLVLTATVISLFGLASCKSSAPRTSPALSASPAAADSYPNLTARAKELETALAAKDYGKVVDLTYPKLVEYAGGREKLLDNMTRELKTMESEGVEIVSSTASAPSQIVQDSNGLYAVVPITSKFKAKDGLFQIEGSLIAISTDAGKTWTFVDATGKDQTELRKVVPNLDKLKLPPEKEPVKVAS